MDLEITPEPSDEERAAVEKALAEAASEERVSPWTLALLPQRESDGA